LESRQPDLLGDLSIYGSTHDAENALEALDVLSPVPTFPPGNDMTDPSNINVQSSWDAVHKLSHKSEYSRMAVGVMINTTLQEEFFNLPLVLAYGTLDDALTVLDTQNVLANERNLGPRMEASKGFLSWVDFPTVWEGKERRNDVAHRAKLHSRQDCLRYIDAVGRELRAWGLISQ
jgi:hypothetical protein